MKLPGAAKAATFAKGVGLPAGAALGGGTGGKGSRQQHLPGPHAGVPSTLAAGEPMDRALGHYGKASKNPALSQIRGGAGGMKKVPRTGGLGPGRMGMPGTSDDYSMTSADLE